MKNLIAVIMISIIAAACSTSGVYRNSTTQAEAPLIQAVRSNNYEVVKHLIASDADVNNRNARGATPLYLAAVIGNIEIAKLLLAAGADANYISSNNTVNVLIGSLTQIDSIKKSEFQIENMTELLLESGANPNVILLSVPEGIPYTPSRAALQLKLYDVYRMLKDYEKQYERTAQLAKIPQVDRAAYEAQLAKQDNEVGEAKKAKLNTAVQEIRAKRADRSARYNASLLPNFDNYNKYAGEEFIELMKKAYFSNSVDDQNTEVEAGKAIKSKSREEREKYSKHEYYLVRWATALNPDISDETLKIMLNDSSPDVASVAQKKLNERNMSN